MQAPGELDKVAEAVAVSGVAQSQPHFLGQRAAADDDRRAHAGGGLIQVVKLAEEITRMVEEIRDLGPLDWPGKMNDTALESASLTEPVQEGIA